MAEWVRDLTSLVVAIGVIVVAVFRFIDQRALQRRLDAQEQRALVQSREVKSVAAAVEQVHKATNSLTDRLVATTEAEALARGGIEERARADERTERNQPNA